MTKLCDKIAQCLPDTSSAPSPKTGFFDSVHFAYQTGALDLVSILLAALGIILGLFALVGFGYIRGQTQGIAFTVAKKTVEEQLEPILKRMDDCIERLGAMSSATRTNAPEVSAAREARASSELRSPDNDDAL